MVVLGSTCRVALRWFVRKVALAKLRLLCHFLKFKETTFSPKRLNTSTRYHILYHHIMVCSIKIN